MNYKYPKMIDLKQLCPSSNDYILIWDVIMYLIDSSGGSKQMTITQQSENLYLLTECHILLLSTILHTDSTMTTIWKYSRFSHFFFYEYYDDVKSTRFHGSKWYETNDLRNMFFMKTPTYLHSDLIYHY